MRRLRSACAVGVLCLWAWVAAAAQPPALELVDVYAGPVDLARYWVSEKYDGVRGYWDGSMLRTRGGQPINAPQWFTAGWPATPMDGELWADYGRFERASTTVRATAPDDAAWREMRYMVFDLPERMGVFDERVAAIRGVVAAIRAPWVVAVEQFRVDSEAALQVALEAVIARGGEGLVLHDGRAPYRAGRGAGLFKLKPWEDAEAQVVGYRRGRGRLAGAMGSLRVRTRGGQEFWLGSGFSDTQRASPPRVGAWVTYRYNGLTAKGLPRFARFLRERPDGPPP